MFTTARMPTSLTHGEDRCTPPVGGCNNSTKGPPRCFWFLKPPSTCYCVKATDCKGLGMQSRFFCMDWCLG
uniref:Putative kunitz n=1 Tax=Rhipicephalus microplus TaxID=6941 RepID=A0A6G5A6I5_RHIMP